MLCTCVLNTNIKSWFFNTRREPRLAILLEVWRKKEMGLLFCQGKTNGASDINKECSSLKWTAFINHSFCCTETRHALFNTESTTCRLHTCNKAVWHLMSGSNGVALPPISAFFPYVWRSKFYALSLKNEGTLLGYFNVKTGLGLDNEGSHTVGKITNTYRSKTAGISSVFMQALRCHYKKEHLWAHDCRFTDPVLPHYLTLGYWVWPCMWLEGNWAVTSVEKVH